MYSERVKVLHIADRYAVVITVSYHFVFNLFPAFKRFLHKHLRREGEGFLHKMHKFILGVAESASKPAEGISGTDYYGVTQTVGCGNSTFHIAYSLAFDGPDINLVKFLNEKLPVFRVHNCLYGRTEHFHSEFLKNALFVKLHSAIKSRLASERKQNSIRTLLFNYFFDKIRSYRKKIYLVGKPLGGLHSRDVRIDEHRLDAFLLEGFKCLRTAIIEFTGLADFKRTRTEQQHFLYGLHRP